MTQPEARSGRSDEDLDRVAERLAPLANASRLKLLRFLARPHYLEEIAAFLGVTRQAARKHLDVLVRAGSLERRSAMRPSGPVTEYVLNPGALFLAHDALQRLSGIARDDTRRPLTRTLRDTEAPLVAGDPQEGGPCFWVLRGPGPTARIPLRSGARAWLIGRDVPDVGLPNDPFASNRHAEVRLTPAGFLVADLGSTNGTLHNWRPLPRGDPALLAHGDVLGVGRTVLLFWEGPRAVADRPFDER